MIKKIVIFHFYGFSVFISKITFALEDRVLWFLGVCISTFSHKNGHRKFQLLKLSRNFFRREELWSVQYLKYFQNKRVLQIPCHFIRVCACLCAHVFSHRAGLPVLGQIPLCAFVRAWSNFHVFARNAASTLTHT